MTRRARLAITIWIAGILACAIIIARTNFTSDMSAFLPRSPKLEQKVLIDQLRNGVVSRLLLLGIEGAPAESLAELSRKLATTLRDSPDFVLVSNGDGSGLETDRDFLWRNRYLLSETVEADRFSVAGLRASLERDLRMLGSDLAPLIKETIPADPTGEMVTLVKRFAADKGPGKRNGVWFSSDGTRALLLAETRAAGFDLDSQQHALESTQAAFEKVRTSIPKAAAAQLQMTGPAVFAVHARETMKEDVSRFALLAAVLVGAALLAVYRSPRLLFYGFLPITTGIAAGIAAVGVGFGYVHGITLGFGAALIGEGVDYGIYLFTQTTPGSRPERTLERIWPILRLGLLTSICGFSVMLFSSFVGFAQLGLFIITGLVAALCVTRWVLPALLPNQFATAYPFKVAPIMDMLIRYAPALRVSVLLIVLAAAAIVGTRWDNLWNDRLDSLSPVSRSDQILDRDLRRDIGAPDVRHLVVASASDEDAALSASEELSARLEPLVKEGALEGFDSPSRYLPSRSMQQKRRSALPDRATVTSNLEEAMQGLPFRSDVFEPFLSDLSSARAQPDIDRHSLQGTTLGVKFDSLLFEEGSNWIAVLPLRGVRDLAAISTSIVGVPNSVLLDLKTQSDRLLQTYRREAMFLALIGGVAILGLLAVSLRPLVRIFMVAVPLACAVIVTTAILTLAEQELTIVHLFGLLLVVAVGSNYALFFGRPVLSKEQRGRTFASVIVANLCTVIGFGVLALSQIPVLHGLGLTVSVGAFLSLLFAGILNAPVRARQAHRSDGQNGDLAAERPIYAIRAPAPGLTDVRTLVIMVPGINSHAEDFETNGFFQALHDRGWPIDAVAIEAGLDLYIDETVVERIHAEIIVPARHKGYTRIWFVGISLGGLGALLYTSRHRDEVDGVILLAPYLGSDGMVAEILRRGGLSSWEPGQIDADDNERCLMAWLKNGRFGEPGWPQLYLGYGRADRFAKSNAMLAKQLSASKVFTVSGGHNWMAWAALWREILNAMPFGVEAHYTIDRPTVAPVN